MVGVDQTQRRIEVGEVLTPQELGQHAIFKGISESLLQKNLGAVVRRTFKKGEIICREGEPGTTAFFILSGKVDIYINSSVSHIRTKTESAKSWFKKITSLLIPGPRVPSEGPEQFIPIDAPIDLPLSNPIAELLEGDLFGEMTCLNFYPRSATVRAAEDCVMFEMLRNILQMLQKNKEFKEHLDANYRRRTLDRHLRSVDFLQNLPDSFIDHLKDRAELVQFTEGQVICEQGKPADSFFLIRIGHVKVSQHYPGGEMVLAYLGRGKFLGEIGLLSNEGIRVATCTAVDHVEAIKILKEDLDPIMERFPEVRYELAIVGAERLEENRERGIQLKGVFLNDILSQSLMNAENLLVLDLEKCTRCDDCVNACAATHDGITRLIREGIRYDKYLVATSCRQCTDPYCMVGCPVGSIVRGDSKEIIIQDWCIGCGLCAKNCPYDNINIHEFAKADGSVRKKAVVCDLCLEHGEPSCVYACPHDAAHRVDPGKFFDLHSIELAFTDKSKPS